MDLEFRNTICTSAFVLLMHCMEENSNRRMTEALKTCSSASAITKPLTDLQKLKPCGKKNSVVEYGNLWMQCSAKCLWTSNEFPLLNFYCWNSSAVKTGRQRKYTYNLKPKARDKSDLPALLMQVPITSAVTILSQPVSSSLPKRFVMTLRETLSPKASRNSSPNPSVLFC